MHTMQILDYLNEPVGLEKHYSHKMRHFQNAQGEEECCMSILVLLKKKGRKPYSNMVGCNKKYTGSKQRRVMGNCAKKKGQAGIKMEVSW